MEVSRRPRLASLGLVLLVLTSGICVATDAPDDSFARGWAAYQAGRYSGAMQSWLPLADAGNADAELNIGILYDAGQGVPVDPVQAATWYRKSAEHGHAAAQYNLGMMYSTGRGVVLDPDQAHYWLALAARQGLQEARAMLPEIEVGSTPGTAVSEHNVFIDSLSGSSTGTAWPVAGGYAITSNHVVASSETVTLYDVAGRTLHATVAARDTANDLAVLSVSEIDRMPPALPLSPVPERLGSNVFTLGFPRVDILGRTRNLPMASSAR